MLALSPELCLTSPEAESLSLSHCLAMQGFTGDPPACRKLGSHGNDSGGGAIAAPIIGLPFCRKLLQPIREEEPLVLQTIRPEASRAKVGPC